jgi:predicted GIY-YIG superfamily endonuclease
MGTVYLLHFSGPISSRHTAQHYLGYTDDLAQRLEAHRQGAGARLVQVAVERGLTFVLVRTWHGDRHLERKLKARKNAPRLCPVCNARCRGFDSDRRTS